MKRLIIFMLICIMPVSVFPGIESDIKAASSVSPTNKYYISFCDTVLTFEEDPVYSNGLIFAQADVLAQYLGASFEIGNPAKNVIVKKADVTIVFESDTPIASVNGIPEVLSASPVIKNGHFMIPAAFVAEKFGYITYYTTDFQKRLAINPGYSDEVTVILKDIENTCYSEDLIDWIVNLYDPELGGFYFKKSARDTVGFLPDRESTANCLGMLKTLGVINDKKPEEFMTAEMIEKMTAFARKYYNPQDGWWYELPWGKYINESKRAYASSGAGQVLKFLGQPVVPQTSGTTLNSVNNDVSCLLEYETDFLPDDVGLMVDEAEEKAKLNDLDTESRYESIDSFKEWLASLDFDNIYTTGSLLLSNLGPIRSAGDEYYDCLMEFIEAHMNPRTGFFSKIDPATGDWVDEISYDAMSGTYKVSAIYGESYYASLGGRYLTMPYYDKLMKSTMDVMLSEESGWHACDLTNPWSLIRVARYSQKDVLGNPAYKAAFDEFYEKLPELLRNTQSKILALLCDDGAYSYYAHTGAGGNKGLLHGLNLKEGEMSGTSMVVSFRERLYQVLCMPMPQLFEGKIGPENIKEKFMSLEPVKKIEPLKKCDFNFDNMESGKLPNGNGAPFRYTGDISIIDDPVPGHGKCIQISADSTVRPVLYFDVGTKGSTGFTVQFDIRFKPFEGDNLLLLFEMGSWDMAVKGSVCKVDGRNRFIRNTDSGRFLTNSLENILFEYHTFKVEYIPSCDSAVTKYYLDGKLLDTSTYYTNDYPEMRPAKDISYVSFRANHSSPFVGYIDNFKFRENPIGT